MFTGKEYCRHIYQIEKAVKSYDVYKLIDLIGTEQPKLTTRLKVEPFRNKSKSTGIELVIIGREKTKWSKKIITGLRPISGTVYFHGNHLSTSKSLMIIEFSPDKNYMIIDYFNGWYPPNPGGLRQFIDGFY